MPGHLKHHRRFYLALLLGALAGAVDGILDAQAGIERLSVAGIVFFLAYLATSTATVLRMRPDDLRRSADTADEGLPLILLITVAAVALSIAAIFALLNHRTGPQSLPLTIALLSVPLGWLTLHTVAALHYAHLFYSAVPGTGHRQRDDSGGLEFPRTEEPGIWDFLYYSFVIGMTAQVSDVQVTSTSMRRLTLAHGAVSFFFNTCLLAMAVNVIVALT
jgi:uncharacterized membrane protein